MPSEALPQDDAVRRSRSPARRREPVDGKRAALRRADRLLDRAERRMRHLEIDAIEAVIDAAERLGGGEERALARVLTLRMRLHRIHDRFDAAMQAARGAIGLWQSLDDAGGEAVVRTQIAQILLAVGDTDEALAEGLAAMTLAERADEAPALVEALRAVGCVYLAVSQFDRAVAFCERGIETSRRLGDRLSEGALLDTLGCVYGTIAFAATAAGDADGSRAANLRSIDLSREALRLARACGHHANEATAVANVAEGLAQDGRAEEALAMMEALALDRPASGRGTSHLLDTRGSICLALGRVDEAIDLFEQARVTATSSNSAMAAVEHAADAYERNGDLAKALASYKRYVALFRQVTSEKAQRSASVAAVRLETQQARASAHASRSLAEDLQRSNEQLSRRAEDLMHDSLHDALTGLGNRRLMERLLQPGTSGIALALVDVDRFKAINDGWSHLIGDQVLQQLATVLRACCRPSDTALRYGGEEFAILLRDIDGEGAVAAAERVRRAIEAADWGRIADGLAVTASIGLARGDEAQDVIALLELADRRLYRAKDAGRNRVVGPD